MELINNNNYNINQNLIEPIFFSEKLDQLNGSIHSVLDEYKKLFILSKMNPNNQEYQQQFSSISEGLNQIKTKLVSTSKDVQINIDKLNKELLLLNADIQREKENNIQLKIKLGATQNETNASSEMIYDYTKIYDNRYIRNWSIVLSTVACILIIGKRV